MTTEGGIVDRAAIRIEPWGAGDLSLLQQALGDPVMMVHLGGPEGVEKIAERQGRYEQPGSRQFKIVDEASGQGVGWVGYWELDLAGGAGIRDRLVGSPCVSRTRDRRIGNREGSRGCKGGADAALYARIEVDPFPLTRFFQAAAAAVLSSQYRRSCSSGLSMARLEWRLSGL